MKIDEDDNPVSPYFEGFRNHWDGRWVGSQELRSCVEQFLIIHLGHQLGTVENDMVVDALEPFEMGREPFRWIRDVEELWDETPPADSREPSSGAKHLAKRLRADIDELLEG